MGLSIKLRRQWTGLERQLLRKLSNSINSINARDERMAARADALGVDGYYFAPTSTDPVFKAMTTLSQRILDCLNLKV